MKVSKIRPCYGTAVQRSLSTIEAPQRGAKEKTMNAISTATATAATAAVNGLAASNAAPRPEWRRDAAALLAAWHAGNALGWKFILAAVNRAMNNNERDALDWLARQAKRRATPKHPERGNATVGSMARYAINVADACLWGVQELTKAGLTVPHDAPSIATADLDVIRAASNNWLLRKGEVKRIFNGAIKVRRAAKASTVQEKLDRIASQLATLVAGEEATFEQFKAAYEVVLAKRIAKMAD